MPSINLIKRDWEKDHVYLVQFPRAGAIPSPSPYALKLETFLRVADIPYTNVNNEFTKKSSRGQVPFIELNGRQLADSSLIIDALVEQFHKSDLDDLAPADKAVARAFYALIEHHLLWIVLYSRGQDFSWLATDSGFGRLLSGIKGFAFKNVILGQFMKKIKARVQGQGMGTFTREEIVEQAKKDLTAISVQLADKQYLFGDNIKTIDIVAFAHLSELFFTPQFSPEIKAHLETRCSNLVSYINRIKDKYWSDWDETTQTMNMNTQWKK